MSKLRGIVSEEVGTLLRALEQGRLKLKPSRSERLNMSPTESKGGSFQGKVPESAQEDEVRTVANTVATELVSPSSTRNEEHDLPDTASDATTPLT